MNIWFQYFIILLITKYCISDLEKPKYSSGHLSCECFYFIFSEITCWFYKFPTELRDAKSMGVNGEFTATVTNALVRFNIYSFVIWLTEVFSLPSETQIQLVETVEVVTTEVTKEDKPSFPLAQSPPAENSAGPSVPESIEVKKRLEIINPHLNLQFDWEKSICVIVSKYFTWTKLFFPHLSFWCTIHKCCVLCC